MKRLPLLLVSFLALLALLAADVATPTVANSATSAWHLRLGSRGARVRDAQWLMQGHNVFKLRTFRGRVNGYYGKRTRWATNRAKYWLGYAPNSRKGVNGVDGVFGPLLRDYLTGAKTLPPVNQARRTQRLSTLRVGDRGRKVKDLQWLLAGKRPSVYRIRTYKGPINGVFGRGTWKAVKKMKWRLGWPAREINGQASQRFRLILLGRIPRPLTYIATASKRVRAARVASECGVRIIRYANSQVGVHEYPWGSNRGRMVDQYERVAPGSVGVPWCASFAQWTLYKAGVGPVYHHSGYVFGIVQWARWHGFLHARPKPGALVAYLSSEGHIGVVTGVGRSGYTSVEGNWSNSVKRLWHPYGYRGTVFIWVPCRPARFNNAQVLRGGFPIWLIVLIGVVSALTATAGTRAVMKRMARKAVHEIGDLADELEEKLKDEGLGD